MMEATRTLADSLLDDLDDMSEGDNEEKDQEFIEPQNEDEIAPTNLDDEGQQQQDDITSSERGKRRPLLEDTGLQNHLKLIENFKGQASSPSQENMAKNYDLIVSSNKWISKLQNEFHHAHEELCQSYKLKFPELEDLVVDPLQYLKAVNIIKNEMDLTTVNEELNQVLSSNQILTISVAGSTTSGRPLNDVEWARVQKASEYMSQVHDRIQLVTSFVESQMEALSPNVCVLVGPTLAARLVAQAGGLAELSRIPACNLQVMGQTKLTASSRAGLFTSGAKPHTGILSECEIVQSCPKHLQRQVLKLIASKVALAARVDCVHAETGQQPSKQAGIKFRHQVSQKIQKLEEPNQAPTLKALPKPDLETRKRRGGKRIRRLKENYEETELIKQANKRVFSQSTGEYGDDAMGLTMGMLDSAQGGALRKKASIQKLRQSNTKASRKKAAQMAAQAANPGSLSSHATSGMASSMVFTPVQGLELVDPSARVKKANEKWFTENAGFQSALPKQS